MSKYDTHEDFARPPASSGEEHKASSQEKQRDVRFFSCLFLSMIKNLLIRADDIPSFVDVIFQDEERHAMILRQFGAEYSVTPKTFIYSDIVTDIVPKVGENFRFLQGSSTSSDVSAEIRGNIDSTSKNSLNTSRISIRLCFSGETYEDRYYTAIPIFGGRIVLVNRSSGSKFMTDLLKYVNESLPVETLFDEDIRKDMLPELREMYRTILVLDKIRQLHEEERIKVFDTDGEDGLRKLTYPFPRLI